MYLSEKKIKKIFELWYKKQQNNPDEFLTWDEMIESNTAEEYSNDAAEYFMELAKEI